MVIRLAKSSDREAVLELATKLMLELGFKTFDDHGVREVFNDLIQDERPDFIMLAEIENKICAICTMSVILALRTKGYYGLVQEMYVLPEHRGKSIGEEMLKKTIEHAREIGCKMVEVGTPPEGSRQAKFYQKVGFWRFGDRYRYTYV